MSRIRKSTPSYLPHQQSGRARGVWTDAAGIRQFKMLPGPFNSQESRSAFATLLLELAVAPHHAPGINTKTITVNELLLASDKHAEQHYRSPSGEPTSEIWEVKIVVRALREMYGTKFVVNIGPLCIKAVRQSWVDEKRS